MHSTYIDPKAVFIDRVKRTFLLIINKPMFKNDDGNWLNIENEAVITYNNNFILPAALLSLCE